MRRWIFALAILVAPVVCRAGDWTLWYDHPAKDWQSECLPIGNGRLGAMVYGDAQHERIQLNEDSLWTGDEKDTGKYQTLGELTVDFEQGEARGYRRALDLSTAIQTVEYTADGVKYKREYIASHPADVLVFHFSTDKPGALTGTIHLVDGHGASTSAAEVPGFPPGLSVGATTVQGRLENGLEYSTGMIVYARAGSVTARESGLHFEKCDDVLILLGAKTNYLADASKGWRREGFPETRPAVKADVDQLRAEHVADYQRLFNRMTVDLGKTAAGVRDLPTDQRLAAFSKGGEDPELEAFLYQYGRYLLISSSRDALPANLQGLWNESNDPPWRCDYHSNINIQMNYWPVEVANLSECASPLFAYFESLRGVRTEATRDYYLNQVDPKVVERKSVRGWTVQTENGIFGGSTWKWNPPGSAWYCLHLWEHYAFTQDKTFLRQTAYPMMKEVCEFWEDHLAALPDGTLVTPDGWSPEHGPEEQGVSYDQEIVWNLFDHSIEAMKVLGVDAEERAKLEGMREKLLKPKVGKWGQLQEWMEDRDDPKDNHRHISHLFALFPGDEISIEGTPELAKAAGVSLAARGDESTGWAMAWRVACWARLRDGEHAYRLLRNFIHLVPGKAPKNMVNGGGVYANLLCAHPPFQIDGNFGYVAGVSEMLLQSQGAEIRLLPALPKAWASGEVKGLRARGNVEVDLVWEGGKLVRAMLRGKGTFKVKYGEIAADVPVDGMAVLDSSLHPIPPK